MARVFVMGGFMPNAGTYMAYHVGLIAAELSGAALFVISENPDERRADIWDYPREAVPVCREEFLRLAGPDDLLIVNPSFSDELFGLRVPCRKLCYVQGFTTFTFLDGFFDCYVSASRHVQLFLKFQYGLSTPCINPFLAPIDVSFVPWEERDKRVLIYHKFKDTQYEAFLNRLKQHCDTEFVSIIGNTQQPRQKLLATIARHKYELLDFRGPTSNKSKIQLAGILDYFS